MKTVSNYFVLSSARRALVAPRRYVTHDCPAHTFSVVWRVTWTADRSDTHTCQPTYTTRRLQQSDVGTTRPDLWRNNDLSPSLSTGSDRKHLIKLYVGRNFASAKNLIYDCETLLWRLQILWLLIWNVKIWDFASVADFKLSRGSFLHEYFLSYTLKRFR